MIGETALRDIYGVGLWIASIHHLPAHSPTRLQQHSLAVNCCLLCGDRGGSFLLLLIQISVSAELTPETIAQDMRSLRRVPDA